MLKFFDIQKNTLKSVTTYYILFVLFSQFSFNYYEKYFMLSMLVKFFINFLIRHNYKREITKSRKEKDFYRQLNNDSSVLFSFSFYHIMKQNMWWTQICRMSLASNSLVTRECSYQDRKSSYNLRERISPYKVSIQGIIVYFLPQFLVISNSITNVCTKDIYFIKGAKTLKP